MGSERPGSAKSIFLDALDLDPSERKGWLDRACAGDDPLRAEVDSLLASHDAAKGFLETPALAAGAGAPEAEAAVGKIIGAYKLTELIGRGGMGAVYLGERADSSFDQRVAVKLIHRGLGMEQILLRFQQERRVLARLEHPRIARLIDGGATPEGAPYIVMEYVDGLPIDRYCKERDLGIEERLRLFIDVCEAVHYAHQNLIVHRDLKPSNILVDRTGQVKLLDFGIAKVLDPTETEAASADLTGTIAHPFAEGAVSPAEMARLLLTECVEIRRVELGPENAATAYAESLLTLCREP